MDSRAAHDVVRVLRLAIRRGEPVLVLLVNGEHFRVERRKYRCVECTSAAVPDLPPLIEDADGATESTGQRTLLPIGALAADWKTRQSGGDE